METQVIELIGRNRLIDELVRAALEVAIPERDCGVDLVAYVDLQSHATSFIARPIQMEAASGKHFSIYRKHTKVRDLILAFVWYVHDPGQTVTYALTYSEALAIGKAELWWRKVSGSAKANAREERLGE